MFVVSDAYELVATEVKPGRQFRIIVESDGILRKMFWVFYKLDGSIYTSPYIDKPKLGVVKQTNDLGGARLKFENAEWIGQGEHPYLSFHGSGRVQAPRPEGSQAIAPSRSHLGFRLRDIREPKLLCHHLLTSFNVYPKLDVFKKFDTSFANIGQLNKTPMFTITAIPFFSPEDMAKIYPNDGNKSVAIITKRLESGIKLMIRISLDYADGSDQPPYHSIVTPIYDLKGGLIIPR